MNVNVTLQSEKNKKRDNLGVRLFKNIFGLLRVDNVNKYKMHKFDVGLTSEEVEKVELAFGRAVCGGEDLEQNL